MVSEPEGDPDQSRSAVGLPLLAILPHADAVCPVAAYPRARGKAQPHGALVSRAYSLGQALAGETPGETQKEKQDRETWAHGSIGYGCSMIS